MTRARIFASALCSLLALISASCPASAQTSSSPGELVTDANYVPIQGARILARNGRLLATTDASGRFNPPSGVSEFEITAPGFAPVLVTDPASMAPTVVLKPAAASESISVTAYLAPLSSLDSPASTRTLTPAELSQSASPALDNKLRLVAGAELFRRSSSLVANPTSQGISLRGLGSTAASRTLVLSDYVPLLDPYGAWVHWEELPELSIRSVEVVRGGASDLYGSSAIGGVINVIRVPPAGNSMTLLSSYGSQNTLDEAALASLSRGKWSSQASGGILRTDGYILTTPFQRGLIDIPSNLHSQNGAVEVDRQVLSAGHAFLRGNVLNEARSNGTPLQTNATRLWRYAAGLDWSAASGGSLVARVFGDNEHYRQGFSSIGAGRNSEALTRLQRTPAGELGGAAHWTQPLGPKLIFLAGADTHEVHATDYETNYKSNQATGVLNTTADQRQTGVYSELLWTPTKWTLSAGGRIDHFSNFNAVQWTGTPVAKANLPDFSQTVFDPRLGLVRRLTPRLSLTASGFRAYRAPTQNELYRTGQVGQELTRPNPSLRSERATGWETGVAYAARNTVLRASYFWTQVNDPITALTISSTPTSTTNIRENLGQIESRGVSFDGEIVPLRWLSLIGGYQHADATVTKFKPQPDLVGNWIPQVAQNTGTLQVRAQQHRLGILSLQGRLSGKQYDNASNTFLLHSYFRLDAYASRDFGRHVEVFAAGENLFDRTIEVGRTPTLTLGTPLAGRIGIRWKLGE